MSASNKQAQLRALMKQQQQAKGVAASQTSNRVDSPMATYTAKGDLVCLVCKVPVKSSALWPNHCASATHKQNLETIVAKKKQRKAAEASKEAEEDDLQPTAKRAKLSEDADDQEHRSEALTTSEPVASTSENTDNVSSNVLTPAILKELRQEWEIQEESVLASTESIPMDPSDKDVANEPPYGSDAEDSDDGGDEAMRDDAELAIKAQQGRQRLTLLKQQQEALASKSSVMDQYEDGEDETDEDANSESSDDVDIDALYDWRARAV